MLLQLYPGAKEGSETVPSTEAKVVRAGRDVPYVPFT